MAESGPRWYCKFANSCTVDYPFAVSSSTFLFMELGFLFGECFLSGYHSKKKSCDVQGKSRPYVCTLYFVAGMTKGKNHILVGEVLHPLDHFYVPPLDGLQQLLVSCTEDYTTSGCSNSCARGPDQKFHYVHYLWKYIEGSDPANTTTHYTLQKLHVLHI